jgi:hypothetical protein
VGSSSEEILTNRIPPKPISSIIENRVISTHPSLL